MLERLVWEAPGRRTKSMLPQLCPRMPGTPMSDTARRLGRHVDVMQERREKAMHSSSEIRVVEVAAEQRRVSHVKASEGHSRGTYREGARQPQVLDALHLQRLQVESAPGRRCTEFKHW